MLLVYAQRLHPEATPNLCAIPAPNAVAPLRLDWVLWLALYCIIVGPYPCLLVGEAARMVGSDGWRKVSSMGLVVVAGSNGTTLRLARPSGEPDRGGKRKPRPEGGAAKGRDTGSWLVFSTGSWWVVGGGWWGSRGFVSCGRRIGEHGVVCSGRLAGWPLPDIGCLLVPLARLDSSRSTLPTGWTGMTNPLRVMLKLAHCGERTCRLPSPSDASSAPSVRPYLAAPCRPSCRPYSPWHVKHGFEAVGPCPSCKNYCLYSKLGKEPVM